MHDRVFRLNELVQAFGNFGSEVVIEEKIHAASFCSNSTACWTASGVISYQRATSSTERLASTLRARTRVGIPSLNTVGWPKLRFGSRAMPRCLPRGHQRSRIS